MPVLQRGQDGGGPNVGGDAATIALIFAPSSLARFYVPLDYTRPSADLLHELDEVAAKARALRHCLAAPNIPLDGFPAERLSELCGALAILPEGTAEGCRAPLAYARVELPRIRRSHVGRVSETPSADAPPSIAREDRLDLLLKDVIASVSTALAQYQADSSAELPEALEPEPSVDATRTDAAKEALIRAEQVEHAVSAARPPVEALRGAAFPHAEDLGRQLSDVRATEGAARAELQSKEAQASQLEMLDRALARLPDVIDKTGVAIEKAADLADAAVKLSKPLRDWAREARRDGLALLISKVKEFGGALRETAKMMRGLSARKPAERPADFDIDKVREMILAGHTPPAAWRPWIEELDFGGSFLTYLGPLASLTTLHSLDLSYTQVSDLDPLADLTTLQQLNLNGTQVSEVGALANLTALRSLTLPDTLVSDIGPLTGLTALQSLSLGKTQVGDVSSLAGLTALQSLCLSGTHVIDVGPLAGLTALRSLDLGETHVIDVGPLAGLAALQSLEMPKTRVSDLRPLAGLLELQTLSLDKTPVSDLDPLAPLTALKVIYLGETKVSDITPLTGLSALQYLDLTGTPVSDARPLTGLTALQTLCLEGTRVSDVIPLAGLTALQWLSLRHTQVSAVTPLAGLKALQLLLLDGTRVSDVGSFTGLRALRFLHLRGTPVSDVRSLAGLTALESLDLSGTRVSDVGSLAELTALRWLHLSGTPVSDVDAFARLTALEVLDLSETRVCDVGALTGAAKGLRVYVESEARRELLAATVKSSRVTVHTPLLD